MENNIKNSGAKTQIIENNKCCLNASNNENEYKEIKKILFQGGKALDKISVEQAQNATLDEYRKFCDFVESNWANVDNQIQSSSSHDNNNMLSLLKSNESKRLAIIKNIMQPDIKEAVLKIFPEIEKATWIPLKEMKYSNGKMPDEYEDTWNYVSTWKNRTTQNSFEKLKLFSKSHYEVQLKPTKIFSFIDIDNAKNYQVTFKYPNPNILALNTKSMLKSVIRTLKQKFYENLFVLADSKIENLKQNGANWYLGGVTQDAKIKVKNKRIYWSNIDQLIKSVIDDYADDTLENLLILMHTDTFTELINAEYPILLTNTDNNNVYFYKGVKLITSYFYPYKSEKISEEFYPKDKPAIIMDSRNISVFGASIAAYDFKSDASFESENMRIVTTRGEVKLTDPHYSSRFLEIE